ncbi:MAG: SIS domain-containing protein [Caldilineaceae bacterium]|nr:SIS domain-containing protein [Caldilineaceae bacterium]
MQSLDLMPWQEIGRMVQILHRARLESRQIFVIGNGGSASTASHMACDLNKNTILPGVPRFKVIALTDNMATLSAYANDLGYENIFAEQLANYGESGDILVAISTSGNSPNVLRAVERAHELGIFTIGWTGYAGGKLAGLVELPLIVPNDCVEQIEDIHMILEHMVTVALRKAAQTVHVAPIVTELVAMEPVAIEPVAMDMSLLHS